MYDPVVEHPMHNNQRQMKELGQPDRDVRSRGTRHRLRAAFSELVLKHPYESLTVRDIARGANVSRSTFYEHFSGKDGLLASGLTGLFAVLADICVIDVRPAQEIEGTSRLIRLLEHFQDNRRLAREVLAGPARLKASAVLIRLIEARLKARARNRPGQLLLPSRLVATQLAGMILAPLTAWLNGECRCNSEALALGLRRACVAALQSLCVRSR
ncbi:MAG: TetR/AcrR family transcriptional regulator [Sinobacteraceae bacterium]|nr:TetR/AcrR family transcriptional regulator [Nevskiaceae bacterium]